MRYALLILAGLLTTTMLFAQAKKPTLMVVPSDVWCNENGYMVEFDDEGTITKVPDYTRIFQEDATIKQVIATINGLMAERGFPLKDLESVLRSIHNEDAELMMTSSKSGSSVAESPVDALKKTAKADIIIELTWTLNKLGPKQSVNFIMRGIDAYSNKQVATATGTGAPSFSAPLPVLLEEAVSAHMDNFTYTLQNHFDDMFENGREVVLQIRRWGDWEEDLESEFGPNQDELGVIIEDWLAENTVQGRFNTTDITENMANFEQVRIPIYDDRGRAMDARAFARELSRFLRGEPYNVTSKLVTKGLGKATLILGGK